MEKKAAFAGIAGGHPPSIGSLRAYLKQHLGNALFRNAYYLMASSLATSGLSFVFWIIATRLYSTEAVGLAGAIVPMIAFTAELSGLGMGFGLMRFLPAAGEKAGTMINTSVFFQLFSSVAAALIFILGINWWSPALSMVRGNFIYASAFVLFVLTWALLNLLKNIFTAYSTSKYVLACELVSRVVAIGLLSVSAAMLFSQGVVASQGVANVVALAIAFALLLRILARKGWRPQLRFDREVFKKVLPFSVANYMGGMLNNLPGWLMPVMVLNMLSAEANAYYYIAVSISSVIGMVQGSLGLSTFVESAHDEKKLSSNLKSALRTTVLLQSAIFLFVLFLGSYVLALFGQQYAENATRLLIILCAAYFPSIVYAFYVAYLRIKNRLRRLLIIQSALPAIAIPVTIAFIRWWGIVGVSLAALATNTLLALGIVTLILVEKRLDKRSLNARPAGLS